LYTTINIPTFKCYKLLATCFDRPCDHHQANFFTDRVPSMYVQYGILVVYNGNIYITYIVTQRDGFNKTSYCS